MNITEIKEKVREVIKYSQKYEFEPNVDTLINQWLEAKRDFIEHFDGKLIVEYPEPVSFTVDTEALDDFIYNVEFEYGHRDLARFIYRNREGFFKNKIICTDDPTIGAINKDMKLVKAFKYFVPNNKELRVIQDKASELIQQDKVTGTLCLSVHPLDFLTASENNHNWRSCHALDGDYRSGNLSYLLDKSTTIMYIKSADDTQLKMFPEGMKWNNKLWRMWLYWSEHWDMIFAGRQYPYILPKMLDFIKHDFLPFCKFDTNKWWYDWSSASQQVFSTKTSPYTLTLRERYYPASDAGLYRLRDIIIDEGGEKALHFNDLLCSHTYEDPYYMFKRNRYYYNDDHPKLRIGSKCTCVRCNSAKIRWSETFLCPTCELEAGHSIIDGVATCDGCGQRFMEEYMTICEDGTTLCDSCFNTLAGECEECGGFFCKTQLIYNERLGLTLCEECNERLEELREEEMKYMFGGID